MIGKIVNLGPKDDTIDIRILKGEWAKGNDYVALPKAELVKLEAIMQAARVVLCEIPDRSPRKKALIAALDALDRG